MRHWRTSTIHWLVSGTFGCEMNYGIGRETDLRSGASSSDLLRRNVWYPRHIRGRH